MLRRLIVFIIGTAGLLAGAATLPAEAANSVPSHHSGPAQMAPVSSAVGGFESFGGSLGEDSATMCLDVLDAGSRTPGPGTFLDSDFCSGLPGQKFTLVADHYGPGSELRADVGSNLCIAVPDGLYNGAPVALETCNGSENQNWAYLNGTLFYGDTSYCLDVFAANKTPRTRVDVATCNGTVAQIWWPWGYTVKIQRSVPSPNGLCLDDYADLDVSGGRVDSGTCNGTNAQIWQFNDYDVIRNVNQEVLQALTPNSTGTGVVDLANSFNTSYAGNYWTMAYQGNGSTYGVEFINSGITSNGKQGCLDVYGDSSAPNTTVDLYQCNATNAQIWQITLTDA
jgi:Ricin-type beta-trefoil lectin domain